MDELRGSYMDPVISCSHEIRNAVFHASSAVDPMDQTPVVINAATDSGDFDRIKADIACHPSYPALLSAYIECRKLGAPPEIVTLLQEIELRSFTPVSSVIGTNPELDEFMESYSEILRRCKEEFSKSINEAKSYFAGIEAQLIGLCKSTSNIDGCYRSDDADGASEDEIFCSEAELVKIHDYSGEMHRDLELKQALLRKYSGYLENLRTEFFKTKKKGKLPKDARSALLDWWKAHCKWPYPTEEEKRKLSGLTGLDTKQVNNWFINQRKRHWKPSAEARVALMESGAAAVYGSLEGGGWFEN